MEAKKLFQGLFSGQPGSRIGASTSWAGIFRALRDPESHRVPLYKGIPMHS